MNSGLTNNALSQSTIGIKIEENLGLGFVGIGHLDTGFNPISGEIADACKSLVEVANALKNGTTLQAFGDGSRCGQAINGEAYAGLRSFNLRHADDRPPELARSQHDGQLRPDGPFLLHVAARLVRLLRRGRRQHRDGALG